MIRKAGERIIDHKENPMGGAGIAEFRHFFTDEEMGSGCRICAQVSLPKGACVGLHPHNQEEEVYIITKGRGIVIDDDREEAVGPGDSILTGGGSSHSIRNEEDEVLEFMALVIRY